MSFSQNESSLYWMDHLASPEQHISNEAKPFCDSDSINNCINYLSKELMALGLPSLFKNGSVQCDKVNLVNVIYCLLQRLSKERNNIEETQERIIRLSSDLDTQRSHLSRLQERLENSEKGSQAHQEKHRQVALKNKILQADLKVERDENRRLQSMLQQRDAQFHHEHRRRERELCQLKERLHQAVGQRSNHQAPGMTLSNGLPRKDGRRGTWNSKATTNKNEDELQRLIISGYEKRNRLLLEEIISLRETLSTLATEARFLLQDEKPSTMSADTCNLQPALLHIEALSGPKAKLALLETWRTFKYSLQNAQSQDIPFVQDKACNPKHRANLDERPLMDVTKNTWTKCERLEEPESKPTKSSAVDKVSEVSAEALCSTSAKLVSSKETRALNLSKLNIEQTNLFRHRSLIESAVPCDEFDSILSPEDNSIVENESSPQTSSRENGNHNFYQRGILAGEES